MHHLNVLRACELRISTLPTQLYITAIAKRFKTTSPCNTCYFPRDRKPCFDIHKVTIERATKCHSKLIRSFLYTHYWPQEPTFVGLWMDINSPYIEIKTEKFSNTGERLLAFEHVKRTNERKLLGVVVSSKVYPWYVDELEEWAHYTVPKPDRHRMFFCAHCIKAPDLFKKYKVDYVYEIECMAVAQEVAGYGLGTLLIKKALESAEEMRHALVMACTVSDYTSKICKKLGMKLVWSMDYSDYVDHTGQRVFYPRHPHHKAEVYIKYNDPKKGGVIPCQPQM